MKLGVLLNGVEMTGSPADSGIDIAGIAYDSRKAGKGDLFVAVRGEHVDGHAFAADAVRRGAAAVVYDNPQARQELAATGAALVLVPDSRRALALLSANLYEQPSEKLEVIGITGTNGKTTTSYLIKSILEAWGRKAGLIGTIQYMVGDEVFEADHTTPEALEFQAMLRKMVDAGCSHVVSEISSHALAQGRVEGTVFGTAVFTNLTRDHLDFHKTMDEYFDAKERLFRDLLRSGGSSVINYDDVWGRRLMARVPAETVITYGLETGADIMAADINNAFDGLRFTMVSRGGRYDVVSSLVGLPNVYNILAAAGAAAAIGAPWNVILEGVRGAGPVKGRFEKIDAGQSFLAVVDYAHTEDALERLIYTARGLTEGKVITVFGCGGDRDRGKRPRMGAIATKLSDFVVMTTDNPRSEDPLEILMEIEKGAVRRNYLIEPDRQAAIRRAVLMADDSDVVLVAGKGHEQYQETAGRRIAFSDRAVLEEAIHRLSEKK